VRLCASPVDAELALDHALRLGEERVDGAASAIVCHDDDYWLEPAAGRSGVLLNGEAVTVPRQLEQGDELQVGPFRLKFQS
jgi:predicted component of type VI protein secretion system